MNYDHRAARANEDDPLAELRGPLCYLATPYTHYHNGLQQAAADAARIAAKLLELGIFVYSPIAHSHQLAVHGLVEPRDYKIWRRHNFKLMEVMDALLIAQLPGWDESEGIADEIEFFETTPWLDEDGEEYYRPIFDLIPETLFMKKRNGAHQ